MSEDLTQPCFKEQLAVVYDDYMSTLGGGERSALAYAKALSDLGFTTQLISTLPLPSKSSIIELWHYLIAGVGGAGQSTGNCVFQRVECAVKFGQKLCYRHIVVSVWVKFIHRTASFCFKQDTSG